jgi:succinoglycan biosynthesis transport protein ExoP
MTVTQYLSVLRKQWPLVLISCLLGGLLGAGVAMVQQPMYSGQLQLFVSTSARMQDPIQLNQGGTFSQERVKSYVDVVTSPLITNPVIDQLNLPYTTDQLAEAVTVGAAPDTVLLDIIVRDSSPERAAAIANAIGAEFSRTVNQLETAPGQRYVPVKVSVTRAATVNREPVTPRPKLYVALGVAGFFVLGIGVAVARQSIDRTIRTTEQAAEISSAPIVATIAEDSEARTHPLLGDETSLRRVEEFGHLRTNIRFSSPDHRLTSVAVVGSMPDEGKTATAANLAIALARAGEQTVLIDADLRRPRVADLFGLPSAPGLSSVLAGTTTIEHALYQWRSDLPLRVLTSGPVPPNPGELLDAQRLRQVVEYFTDQGVVVIVDTPPLLPFTDGAVIARATDGVLLVTRIGATKADQLEAAVRSLQTVGARVLGFVASRVRRAPWEKSALANYQPTESPARV